MNRDSMMRVDLTSGSLESLLLDEATKRACLGGSALGAKYARIGLLQTMWKDLVMLPSIKASCGLLRGQMWHTNEFARAWSVCADESRVSFANGDAVPPTLPQLPALDAAAFRPM